MKAAPVLLALPLLAAASTPAGFRPGLWRITTAPAAATLDGRGLVDLPYTPPPPEEVCLSTADAADPARWFVRDSAPGCRWSKRNVAGGRVAIEGRCPAEEAGQPDGTTRLTGTWTPVAYRLAFKTVAHGDNGTMGLDGTIVGRRVGEC